MATIIEILLGLWPVVIILAAPLMLAPFWVRLTLFILGPGIGLAIAQLSLGGPDSPLLVLPVIGLCVSIAALLAEGLARISDLIRKRVAR